MSLRQAIMFKAAGRYDKTLKYNLKTERSRVASLFIDTLLKSRHFNTMNPWDRENE